MSVKRSIPFVILFAALAGLGATPFMRALDLSTTNSLLTGHFPHPDIAILAVDDKSIGTIGRWPWDRSVEGALLTDIAKFSPRAIGIDIDFSEAENAASDSALAKSIAKAGAPVVLPIETVQYSDGSSAQLSPLAQFKGIANVTLGSVDVPLTADNTARAFPPSGTFALEVARAASGTLPASTGSYDINFAGPAGTFATYSISDVLAGTVPAENLQDKIILIGATANDLHDFVNTPFGMMPGIEWHANIVDNIMLDRPLFAVPPWWVDGIGLLLAAALLVVSFRLRTRIALGIAAAFMVAFPVASLLALRADIFIPYFTNEIVFAGTFAAFGLYRWYLAEAEKRRVRRTVQNYFSPAVLDLIMKDPKTLSLGGERKEVTILFSDIRSFTTITESTPPETLTKLLHEYFTEMTEEILATDGVLDKFIGDAIMAFWGAPLEQPDHADRAVRAAQGMMRRLAALQNKWATAGLPHVDIGVGIHTGTATVGNMGSEKRFDYTVIGDAVNTASRLEGLNKEHKTHIIISEATKTKLNMPVKTRAIGDVIVKGKTVPVKIYTLD